MEKIITELKIQKKNPSRVNVYLDNKFAFGISRFVSVGLKLGEKIDQDFISELIEKDAREKAYQKALYFIHYRPRSSYEVQAKLVKLGFETPIIESVIEELLEKKYIDDREFAINWVASRSRSKPRSREMLRYELRKKKISEDTIDDVIATVPGNDELAVQLGKKYLRRYTHCSDKEFKEKMAGVLARRLFPYSVIRTAIIELIKIRNK